MEPLVMMNVMQFVNVAVDPDYHLRQKKKVLLRIMDTMNAWSHEGNACPLPYLSIVAKAVFNKTLFPQNSLCEVLSGSYLAITSLSFPILNVGLEIELIFLIAEKIRTV